MSIKNFVSDGCTGVPDFDFRSCCEQHDAYYHDGSVSRATADFKMFTCINNKGKGGNFLTRLKYTAIALYYWAGVRIFGGSYYKAD